MRGNIPTIWHSEIIIRGLKSPAFNSIARPIGVALPVPSAVMMNSQFVKRMVTNL